MTASRNRNSAEDDAWENDSWVESDDGIVDRTESAVMRAREVLARWSESLDSRGAEVFLQALDLSEELTDRERRAVELARPRWRVLYREHDHVVFIHAHGRTTSAPARLVVALAKGIALATRSYPRGDDLVFRVDGREYALPKSLVAALVPRRRAGPQPRGVES